jgi:quercetin dioxygenase-like cupin family protein
MRLMIASLLLAAVPAQTADTPPPPNLQFDVPADHGPQEVRMLGLNFAPGQTVPLHVHRGVEMAYVISGTIRFRLGDKTEVKHAGDSTLIPRGVPHEATNIGSDVARVASTFVIDKGAPLRIPVGEDGKPLP